MRGGGGGGLVVRPPVHARCEHDAGTRRGTCLFFPLWGGGVSRVAPFVPCGSDYAVELGGQGMPQMNPPPVSPRLYHRTSGASMTPGGGRDPGDESARPLCSRHFQRTDTTAPVSGRSEVDTQAPGRGWAVSPPRAVGCRHRGPLCPGQRMAQEAFEAYGKSSPLPALPHLPFPPGYVPPPVSMGTGGSRHGTPNTMRRRGDYCQGAAAAGEPWV